MASNSSFHAPRAHGFVRVAAATPVVHVADPAANADEHERLIRQAGEQGVDLLVFPELSLSAYAIDGNAASIRVLERCGFVQGMAVPDIAIVEGKVVDGHAYALDVRAAGLAPFLANDRVSSHDE